MERSLSWEGGVQQFLSQSSNFRSYVEPGDSLSCAREPAIGSCPGQV